MYVPKTMALTEAEAIEALIADYGFGLLISPDMETTHLPLLYDSDGDASALLGHMAKSNPQWRGLSGKRVSVVFHGPHSYISPRWYVSRPAVSTWNYAAVQCFGTFQQLEPAETLDVIHALIQKYEPEILGNDELMPPDYKDKLLKAVVGFKIVVDDIHGKEKLGQHKSADDQLGVFDALRQSSSLDANELASYMHRRGVGTGGNAEN